jgi:hypothetical protein
MPGTLSANGTWQYRLIETGSGTPYSLTAIQSYIFFFDELQQSRTGQINQTFTLQTEFTTQAIPPGNYYFQLKQKPNSATPPLPIVTMDPQGTSKSYLQITKVNQAADGRIMNIPLNMPFGTNGIKQIDFLTSLQKKYNLVMYPSKVVRNEFIVEPFNQWYSKGRRWDFNKYANLDEKIEVIPANNLAVNELNFGDLLDQDYISQQFSKEANREFGKAYFTDTENFFSQGKFEVKTAVASTQLLQIAGTGVSGSVQGVNPAPTRFFAGNVKLTPNANPIYACNSPISEPVYTIDGTFAFGNALYYDQYGQSLVTGFRWFVVEGAPTIIEINFTTGIIGSDSIFSC